MAVSNKKGECVVIMDKDGNATDTCPADIRGGLAVHSASKGGFGYWFVTQVATGWRIPIPNFYNTPGFGFSTYLVAYGFRNAIVGLRDWTVENPEPITKHEHECLNEHGLAGCRIEEDFAEQLHEAFPMSDENQAGLKICATEEQDGGGQ